MTRLSVEKIAQVIAQVANTSYWLTGRFVILEDDNYNTFAVPFKAIERIYNQVDDIDYDLKVLIKEQGLVTLLDLDKYSI